MKKARALTIITVGLVVAFYGRKTIWNKDPSPNLPGHPTRIAGGNLLNLVKNAYVSPDSPPQDSDHVPSAVAHPNVSFADNLEQRVPAGTRTEAVKAEVPVTSPAPPPKLSGDTGPSIGTVRVLGHRGCDINTKGWFLSVGNPEQYDFSVSEDGETLVVEPNTPHLTGNFEFVHCAEPGDFVGKKARFSARIKAQTVNQTAQLRLRGENFRGELILKSIVPVVGTYDWKDFSAEAEVGPEVALFSYGLSFRSTGKIWISHPVITALP